MAVHRERYQRPAALRHATPTGYFKDAFHDYVVDGSARAINPRAARHQGRRALPARRSRRRPALSCACACQPTRIAKPFAGFDAALVDQRRREADEFYDRLQQGMTDDQRLVQRQALAGMIWSKQFFYYDVPQVAERRSRSAARRRPSARHGRNHEWMHLNNADIISMPDKWEYPWYAAWDLAFHTIALALVDPEFAKAAAAPADARVVHAPERPAAGVRVGVRRRQPAGARLGHLARVPDGSQKRRRLTNPDDPGDLAFLERVFHKLMLNFTWWVNRKDAEGRNVFQGGFLGLDNIGVFDRSAPLPTGGYINQSDGTSWMAMYSLNLMRIALELAQHNHVYEDIATKFFEHFLHIAEAMTKVGDGMGLWDDEDGFFYDVLNLPDGQMLPLKVRSMVGLIPLFAVETLEPELCAKVPEFTERLDWFLNYRPDLAGAGLALERAGQRRAPAAVAAARQPHEEAAEADARRDRSSCPTTACARSRGITASTRTRSTGTASASRSNTSRANRRRGCSAAIRTGAGRSGCR